MTKPSNLRKVTLSKPVTIDGEQVTDIHLRKPSPGELRGLKLTDILQMDVDAITTLLPRITVPPLSPMQISSGEIDTPDFMDLAAKTTLFFVKQEQLAKHDLEIDQDQTRPS